MPLHLHHYPLLHGPYPVPAVRVGRTATCLLRGKAKVCGWTDGRIPWPLLRVGHGGNGRKKTNSGKRTPPVAMRPTLASDLGRRIGGQTR